MKNVLGKGSKNNNFLTQPSCYAIITLTEKSIIIKSDEEKMGGFFGIYCKLTRRKSMKRDNSHIFLLENFYVMIKELLLKSSLKIIYNLFYKFNGCMLNLMIFKSIFVKILKMSSCCNKQSRISNCNREFFYHKSR